MIRDEDPAPYDAAPERFEAGFVMIPAVFRTITGPVDAGDGKKPLAKGVVVAVYQAIAAYADHRAVAYPSHKTIADDTGWSEDHVARAVKALANLGIIRIEQRETNGFKRSNQYILVHHLPGTKHTAPNGIVPIRTPEPANVQIPSPTGAYPLTAGLVPVDSGLGTRSQRVEQEPVELEPKEQDVPTSSADKPFDLVAAMCEAQGQTASVIPARERGKQCKVAERMIADGYTATDVFTIVRWLKATWSPDGIDMFLVEKQAGKWRLAGQPSGRQANPDKPERVPFFWERL